MLRAPLRLRAPLGVALVLALALGLALALALALSPSMESNFSSVILTFSFSSTYQAAHSGIR